LRFAPRRFKKFVGSLAPDQIDFVRDSGFGSLLNVSDFKVRIPFLEWIMSNIVVGVAEFHYNGKRIKFRESMISTVFGIPSANVPIDFSNFPEQYAEEVKGVTDDCLEDKDKPAISCAITLCLAEHNQDAFMRSFMLVALATILCPRTQNSVDLKYLYYLMRSAEIQDYNGSFHLMQCIFSEVMLTVYFGAPSMFITLWFGFDYGTNPPLGTLII
jgi:hypothetical protein